MLPFLSDDEIAQICDPLIAPAAQRRYLARLGLIVNRKPNGRPLVARAEFDRVLGDKPAPAALTTPRRVSSYPGSALEAYHRRLRESAAIAAAELADAQAWTRRHWSARRKHRRQARAALVRHHSAKRRAAQLQRTPAWADHEAIRRVYEEAQRLSDATGEPHHVDHEIPLQGERVSGLHVHNNLRALPARDNIVKSNRFDIEG